MKRISVVQAFKVNAIQFSGTVQIGDSACLNPASRVLAVYREIPTFSSRESESGKFAIPNKPIVQPVITERLRMRITNRRPFIAVNRCHVLGISTAGVVQIGSTRSIRAENRARHIRHLFPRPRGVKLPAEIGVPPHSDDWMPKGSST